MTGAIHIVCRFTAVLLLLTLASCDTSSEPGLEAGFSLSVGRRTLTVEQGSSEQTTLRIDRSAGFSRDVRVSLSESKRGITASVSPATVPASSTAATITFAASASSTLGVDTILVRAEGAGRRDSTIVVITVVPRPSFAIRVLNPPAALPQNSASAAIIFEPALTGNSTQPVFFTLMDSIPAVRLHLWQYPGFALVHAIATHATPPGHYSIRVRASALGFPDQIAVVPLEVVPARATQSVAADARISAGHSHACALSANDIAYCWGRNDSGYLGDGTAANRLSPVAGAGGLSLTSVSAGYSHTCGVTAAGVGYCWGLNNVGQLGNGTGDSFTAPALTPTMVAGNLHFRVIRVGHSFACGLTNAGTAYCWGEGSFGSLGNGSFASVNRPQPIAGGVTFTSIDAGVYFACGLVADGTVYCWGQNIEGQLGDGTRENRSTPVRVNTSLRFTQIATGGFHACGLTAAGTAHCWGSNGAGQLGNDSTNTSFSPVQVVGGLTFGSISAGENHSCALTTTGAAVCWGSNRVGQLGNGTAGTGLFSARPVGLLGDFTVKDISAAANHTCAITTAGDAYCWGLNIFGQLGNGSDVGTAFPGRVLGNLKF